MSPAWVSVQHNQLRDKAKEHRGQEEASPEGLGVLYCFETEGLHIVKKVCIMPMMS